MFYLMMLSTGNIIRFPFFLSVLTSSMFVHTCNSMQLFHDTQVGHTVHQLTLPICWFLTSALL